MFLVQGLVRGSIRQVFGLLGFVAGLVVALLVFRWVGAQWLGARPAAVLWAARYALAGIAGFVVLVLFHWWGSLLGKAVKAGPAGWLDRVLGGALGALIGLAWGLALVLLLLFLPGGVGARRLVREARTAHALVVMGTRACDVIESRAPVLHGLGRVLHEAERRARADAPARAGADSRSS